MKGVVGGVACEVIVIARMVITGPTSMVTERTNNRQMMSLPGEKRQVFAQLDVWGRGTDGLKGAAIFEWCQGFHVPRVDVGSTAA